MDSHDEGCFVCDRMRERNPRHRGKGIIQTCLLCDRDYCELHESGEDKEHKPKEGQVCEINHRTYYRKHPHLRNIYPTTMARNKALHLEADATSDDTSDHNHSSAIDENSA